MAPNYFDRYDKTSPPTLTVLEKEAGITQSGASAASSEASAEATRAKMVAEKLENQRRRATPEEVEAEGLDSKLSYQINGFGKFFLNPGQTVPKAKLPYDPEKIKNLKSAIEQVENAEKLAKDGFFTVGRRAEIITGLPVIGGLLDQDRVDFLSANEAVNSAIMRSIVEKSQQDSPTGVTGMFNNPIEQQIAAAAKVQLNPSQSEKAYLTQTPRAKRFFQGLIDSELAKLGDKYPDKQSVASSSQKVTVLLPDGRVASFPNQQSANAFKRKAGIR